MTTNMLILRTYNSARSMLTEGMLNYWAQRLGKDVRAYSAGSAPSGRVNPFAHTGTGVRERPLLLGPNRGKSRVARFHRTAGF